MKAAGKLQTKSKAGSEKGSPVNTPAERNGRPKDDPGRKVVDIAVAAALAGITPIEVMLDNMRFAHDKAEDLLGKLVKIAQTMDPGTKPDGSPMVNPADLIDMFREHCRFRSMSQSCATDVAPYIHPKYSTITLNTDDDSPPIAIHIRRTIVDPAPESRVATRNTNVKKVASTHGAACQ